MAILIIDESRCSMPLPLRFLILSDPRSGTMMLADAIDEHPCVRLYNLYASNPDNPKIHHKNWEKFQQEIAPGVTHRGTTMHRVGDGWIKSLSPISSKDFWAMVADHHDKYVCLHRENILRRFLSKKVGVILRGYGVHSPREKDPGPIRISIQELMEFIEDTKMLWEKINHNFPDRLVVTYEKLSTDWNNKLRQIQAYLGLPQTEIQPVTYRQENRPLVNAIENYQEIYSYLSNRDLGSWLN